MAAKVAGNPTANLFSLLSDDAPEPSVVASAPKVKKEAPAKKAAAAPAAEKDAAAAPAALTPAEKAKLREAKAPKAAKPAQERAPRRDAPAVDERVAGPRGTGNRGARRAVNAEPHGHQAPKRGREFDRQSAGQYSRNPPMKKGGAGKGNWGDAVKDSVVEGETPAAEKPVAVEGEKTEETTEAVVEEPAAPAEPEDTQLTLDDYLKQKEEAAKALAAKVGAIQPRKLENVDLKGAVESKKAADAATAAAPAASKTEAANARKGTKALDVSEVFKVRTAPVGDREDRPRGGARGGARGGRGGARGGRGGAPRADGARPPRAEGEQSRGGRGGDRGASRGAPRGRALDTSNNRQFPSLGQ